LIRRLLCNKAQGTYQELGLVSLVFVVCTKTECLRGSTDK
jgi:hypothetical protein